jgi:hypothetical protein
MGMGMTHDVKNSKTGKNGAATEVFQLMTSPRGVETTMEKALCRNDLQNTPALGPRPRAKPACRALHQDLSGTIQKDTSFLGNRRAGSSAPVFASSPWTAGPQTRMRRTNG